MAYLSGSWKSRVLHRDTHFEAIVPYDDRLDIGHTGDPKLLILLHGAGGGSRTWTRFSAVEQYIEKKNVVVIMPEGDLSFYLNMKYGMNFEDYIVKELPDLAQKFFRVSLKREDITIAGLSMGGFGALHSALKFPEVFGQCGVFSAPCSIAESGKPKGGRREHQDFSLDDDFWDRTLMCLSGDGRAFPEDTDLYRFSERCCGGEILPRVFHVCGTEDELFDMNQRLALQLSGYKNLEYEFVTMKGAHYFDVWDPAIRMMIERFY